MVTDASEQEPTLGSQQRAVTTYHRMRTGNSDADRYSFVRVRD